MPLLCVDNPSKGSQIKLEVDTCDQVDSVKKLIADLEGIPISDQNLSINGQELLSGTSLHDYGVIEGGYTTLPGRAKTGSGECTPGSEHLRSS